MFFFMGHVHFSKWWKGFIPSGNFKHPKILVKRSQAIIKSGGTDYLNDHDQKSRDKTHCQAHCILIYWMNISNYYWTNISNYH